MGAAHAQEKLPLETIQLPPGFKIEVYAANVPNARAMVLGERGTLFVGSRKAGNVYAVLDKDQDQKADQVFLIDEELWMPAGVDFREGDLYVSAINRVIKYEAIEDHLSDPPEPVVVNDTFPDEVGHGWKFIRSGPDGWLYVPVGAPCNVCEPGDARYASIMRMQADGSELEIFAKGVRNTVGFDWHPETKELWFTDNGRDWLGDNLPPDELNHAPQKGLHFGFPYCHGKNLSDPAFGDKRSCDEFVPVAQALGPHVAALGMRFYTGDMFPEDYRHQIFIAEHGSWNRSVPIGSRVMLVRLENNRPVSYESFAEGWLQGKRPWGQPADVLVMPDGALLVSDDKKGVIYRISYEPPVS